MRRITGVLVGDFSLLIFIPTLLNRTVLFAGSHLLSILVSDPEVPLPIELIAKHFHNGLYVCPVLKSPTGRGSMSLWDTGHRMRCIPATAEITMDRRMN